MYIVHWCSIHQYMLHTLKLCSLVSMIKIITTVAVIMIIIRKGLTWHHSIFCALGASHKFFPGYGTCPFQYQLNFLGSIQCLLPSWQCNHSNTQAITVQLGPMKVLSLSFSSIRKMPEREDDHLTPATRLLEKRREMAEVEQALAAQKEVHISNNKWR